MNFPSIRLEGSILTADLLDAVAREDKYSQKPADFGLPPSGKVKDEIASTWASAKALWSGYRSKIAALREGQTGATETRNLFILPLLAMLGYQPEKAEAEIIGGKTYAISHRDTARDAFPLHIMGWHDSLEQKRVAGGPRVSPHALVQEYLNLTEHLYALITNGRQLRLLRDSSRLIKLTFMEFDLIRIFEEDLYADFAILFRVLHATRMPANRANASASVIEKYHQDSVDSGSRIRDGLAAAVAFSMQTVANGLLSHPKNAALIAQLGDDPTSAEELHKNLLRWVYRTLFVLVIEERGLNHAPAATLRQRQLYRDYYSLQRLRRLADRPQLADHRAHDLWRAMHQTLRLYEDGSKGLPLGIPPLGSFLFREAGLHALFQYQLDNRSLLLALHRLSTFTHPDTQVRMRVNYGALDVEEFGSVYESLLELRPRIIPDGEKLTFSYAQLAGNERKTTGSYYTPDSLVQCLMDSALDPVVEERLKGKTGLAAEEALLSIKVCDPAVGSGHFLIGAAHRLAQRLAEIRAGEEALSPDVQRHALRDVVSRCLYGVDINPLSVELCKVGLWMLALEPGKPLGFLDHHIQCGNSLLGSTPRVLADGLPDDAFKPIAGDDKTFCAETKKRNKSERQQLALFHGTETKPWETLGNLPAAMLAVGSMNDDTADGLHRKEQRYAELVRSASYENARFLADAWCAAFVWKKCLPADGGFDYAITNDVLRKIERNPHDCAPWMREEIERLRDRYQFFHWHLAFPEVFPVPEKSERSTNERTGWNGGFDLMLGNPPWERVKLQEKEWFSGKDTGIAEARNPEERRERINDLLISCPSLFEEFQEAKRQADGEGAIIRNSDRFPLCGTGDLNTYAVFAELCYSTISRSGRVGLILPTALITGTTTRFFFEELMHSKRLVSFVGFDNEEKTLFPDIDNNLTFAAVTMAGEEQAAPVFCFNIRRFDQINDRSRYVPITEEDLALFNPNTRTCPVFRNPHDAEIIRSLYARLPVIWRDGDPHGNTWGLTFSTMFHAKGAAHLFRDETWLLSQGAVRSANRFIVGAEIYLPLFEAKMIGQFEHRWATFYGKEMSVRPSRKYVGWYGSDYADPLDFGYGKQWVVEAEVDKNKPNDALWFIAFRNMTNRDLVRTSVFCVIPKVAVVDSAPLIALPGGYPSGALCFIAERNSFVGDFITRNKLDGSHLTYSVLKQVAALPPATYAEPCAWAGHPAVTHRDWLLPRVLELTCTAWDLEPFARDCGWFGPPFVWDEARRFQLRCELDAAFLHLYGLSRADAAYILDTFPIVRRKDEAAHGTYRTRDTILALYDQFVDCAREARAFVSPLAIQPAGVLAAHEPRLPAKLRPAFASPDYFQHIVPLIARLQPQGIEVGRLLHALEILAESEPRRAALNGHDGEPWKQWAKDFPKSHAFSDAAAALIVLLGEGTLARWQGRIRLEPDALVLDEEWLNADAFMALRLALAAPAETVQRRRAQHEQHFPALRELLLVA